MSGANGGTGDAFAPLILAVAPNGARKTRADHPALPITPNELARTAAACAEAGASMIHLHVRDEAERHSLDVEAYRAATAAVRAAVGEAMIVQVTSEAVGRYDAGQQMAMVRALRPEAVSLAVRELIPQGTEDDPAREAAAADFLAWLDGEGILAQFILYSSEDLERFDLLIDRGVVPGERRSVLYVLGRYSAGQRSDPSDLLPFLAARRRDHLWSLCAFGAKETACAVTAAGLGGHARVGFENNLLLPDGSRAPDNAALVAAVARGAAAIGRPLADAAEARRLSG